MRNEKNVLQISEAVLKVNVSSLRLQGTKQEASRLFSLVERGWGEVPDCFGLRPRNDVQKYLLRQPH